MAIDRTGSPHAVSNLLDAADKQTLGIPEFQRDFVWSPQQIAELIRTVARDWPCGAFLIQESSQQSYACRAIEGAPRLRRPPLLIILDGQQRITALYQALREHGDETYFIAMREALDAGQLEDEHVQYTNAAKYRKLYPDLAAEARTGIARVATLARDDEFFKWAACLDEADRPRAIKFRSAQLPGLKHYSIPCVVLPPDTPLEAVARIFETTNRTGIRLDVFDLMVAKLYPSNFLLRDKNKQAIARHPVLDEYDVAGLELLRLIALREHLRQTEARGTGQRITIRGVRRSDVIELPATVVQKDWDAAVRDSARALEFVMEECGVVSPSLLPSRSMLLPLAANISAAKTARHKSLLRTWFWQSSIAQTHSQGANTQVVTDAKRLRSALATGIWDEVWHPTSEVVDTVGDVRKRNEILLRGVCCSLVMRGALEPRIKTPLGHIAEPLDVVPLFAYQSLAARDVECIPNQIVVAVSTRRLMGTDYPSMLIRNHVLTKEGLQSQAVDSSAAQEDDWTKFRQSRTEALRNICRELIKP
jgi:hypothetical protein